MVVSSSEKITRRTARKRFVKFMNENNYRYRMSNDHTFMDSGFELADGHSADVHYDFNPDESRITLSAQFLTIETYQIPQAALLITHLNTLIHNGKLMINFRNRSIYFQLEISCAAILLNPTIIENLHHQLLSMPNDFIWCFQQVLEVNEDPVVVMGELMRKYGI
jgi:hypothetical protein